MTIQIDQRGGIFYVYKNYKTKGQPFDYVCQVATGWRWAWAGDELTIYDTQKNEVGYLYFKRRVFQKSEFYFHFKQNDKTIKIEPTILKSFKDWVFKFQLEGNEYIFSTHKSHYKSLFKNGQQVAQFDKNYFHFFNRDTFIILANDDIDVLLLIILATFNSLNDTNDGATFNIDLGNIFGSTPPEEGKWKPRKTPTNSK
ncbi:MAG: hypothetical protein JST26_04560 [Bacteroidetes bacterium]|nr:hypothetical protein [Bacteroidota bacterium]